MFENNNKCEHEWEKVGTTIIDPDGWYYKQPCYRIEYVCVKCGEREYKEV